MKYAAWHPDRFSGAAADRSEWIANSPYGLAENLRGLDLWFSAGSGSLEESKDRDLLETMIKGQGERFSARLNALGIRHSWFPRTSGLHNWTSWERELGAWLKTLERRRDYGDSNRRTKTHQRREVADGGEFSFLTAMPSSTSTGGGSRSPAAGLRSCASARSTRPASRSAAPAASGFGPQASTPRADATTSRSRDRPETTPTTSARTRSAV